MLGPCYSEMLWDKLFPCAISILVTVHPTSDCAGCAKFCALKQLIDIHHLIQNIIREKVTVESHPADLDKLQTKAKKEKRNRYQAEAKNCSTNLNRETIQDGLQGVHLFRKSSNIRDSKL